MIHWRVARGQSTNLLSSGRRLLVSRSRFVSRLPYQSHSSPCFFSPLSHIQIHPIRCRFLSGSSNDRGKASFLEYQAALRKLEELREAKQAQQSTAMFQAWQEQQESNKPAKSGGVQVIRTLVREQQPQKDTETQALETQAQNGLEAAIEAGYGPALLTKANELLGQATLESVEQAISLYKQAGLEGHATAWFNLGHVLWTGVPDQTIEDDILLDDSTIVLRRDPQAAMQAFESAMELGDTDALYFCGVQYLNDDDHPVDKRRAALDWIEQAAAMGHSEALYYLALFYRQGHDDIGIPTPTSPRDFIRRLEAAVQAQSPEALFLRGHSFYTGEDGYAQDYRRALSDFVAAADLGHADAAVSAGAMLCMPHAGVRQDAARAFSFYQRAGELGSKEGWRNVVDCYLTGRGVPQSTSLAKYIAETMLRD